ncbi:unnamed protein product [Callosobruchus maculatus]|uniref:C2H2-type domain-containing protein n=1 Tax=Callosobruchus maculatus TaxID=64391 RepID=A0A653DL14_CALMS|nr:unnamed protein product [Callosobruchus maculatus]
MSALYISRFVAVSNSITDPLEQHSRPKRQTFLRLDKVYRCSSCGKAYAAKCSFNRHLKYECGKPRKFACSRCNYKAYQKVHVESHLCNRHHIYDIKVWVYLSPDMVEAVDPLAPLSKDEGEMDEDDIIQQAASELVECKYEVYECPKCFNIYQSKHSLSRHLKFECQIEPSYFCPVEGCTYKGKYDVSVKRHMANVHTGCKNLVRRKKKKKHIKTKVAPAKKETVNEKENEQISDEDEVLKNVQDIF